MTKTTLLLVSIIISALFAIGLISNIKTMEANFKTKTIIK